MKNIINKIKFGKVLIAFIAFIFIFSNVGSVYAAATFSAGTNPMPFATTIAGTSNWTTNISSINAGDRLNLSSYYYTADTVATNAKATVDVSPAGASNTYTVTSTLSADGFTDYVNTLTINLNYIAPSFTFETNARWLHDAVSGDASHGYATTDTPAATISGTQISYNLGTVNTGYINDGYIEFYIAFDPSSTPVANAGPDQTVGSNTLVQLDGSASTGIITSYAWACDAGIILSDATIVNPTFTSPTVPAVTNYTCSLTTTNLSGSTSDSMITTVNPVPVPGAPIANAGPDQSVTSGALVQLTGAGSVGVGLTYLWSAPAGITLSDPTIVNPTFSAPTVSAATNYTMNLTVTDSTTATATDSIVVTANPSGGGGGGGGGGPIIYYDTKSNAGPDQIVNSGALVQLDGSASTGTISSYLWDCGTGIIFSDSNIVNPTFPAPTVDATKTYTCTLTVVDSVGTSNEDSLLVAINPSNGGGGGGGGGLTIIEDLFAKTLPVTENNGTYVKLNALTEKCGTDNCEGKFNWGSESLENSTSWQANLKTGDKFASVIQDLQKGTAYYFNAELKTNGQLFTTDGSQKFITKPDAPQNFIASLTGNNVNLSWGLGEGSYKTLVKRGTNQCPELTGSGETLYFGQELSFIDTDVTNNNNYCYRAWSMSFDGLDIIFSDSTQREVQTQTTNTTSVITKTVTTPTSSTSTTVVIEEPKEEIYVLKSKTNVRNATAGDLNWENSINASPEDEIEFNIEIKNESSTTLKDVVITNQIDERIAELKNVLINGVEYPTTILANSFIRELPANEDVIISFSGKISEINEDANLTILTEVYSQETKPSTNIITIYSKHNLTADDASASIFSGAWFPWIVLLILILVLTIIYLILKRRRELLEIEE